MDARCPGTTWREPGSGLLRDRTGSLRARFAERFRVRVQQRSLYHGEIRPHPRVAFPQCIVLIDGEQGPERGARGRQRDRKERRGMFGNVERMEQGEWHCRDEERGNGCGEDLVPAPMMLRSGLVVSDLPADPVVGKLALQFVQASIIELVRSRYLGPSVPNFLEGAQQPVL